MQPVPGLILALRFDAEGRAEFLPVDRPIDFAAPGPGWLWVHYDLVDGRLLHWLDLAAALSPAARAFLLSHETHQQIEGSPGCILASFDDLVRDLDSPTEEIAPLRMVVTERLELPHDWHVQECFEGHGVDCVQRVTERALRELLQGAVAGFEPAVPPTPRARAREPRPQVVERVTQRRLLATLRECCG